MNEDAYEDYCMAKMELEEEIENKEDELKWMLEDVECIKSDIQSLKEELDELSVEDFVYGED